MISSRRRAARPELPHEELARQAAFAKPQYGQQADEQMDTRGLRHAKIHPERDPGYLKWLHFQPCAVAGRTDARTGQPHVCWSPRALAGGRFESDPAHTGKAFSGALKRSDKGAFSICRHAHRQQEDNMDSFDERFGISRHDIAERQYAEYQAEQERRS